MGSNDPTEKTSPDEVRQLIAAGEREAATLSGMLPRPAPPRDAVPGYDILSEVGRGGMGVVYRAFQLSTKRVVALKVMLAGWFASSSARARFQREVELTARLQHPGVVRVLESGLTSSGQQYYAMDYVEGTSLDRWLKVSQPDVRRTLAAFGEICDAVEHAHCHGVVHRDLKPTNILMDEEGKPHILDFGLAKATDQGSYDGVRSVGVSLPGQIVGTLRYLSPEQASSAPGVIDARTDVYALGVLLYEALTDASPVDVVGDPSDVMRRIREEAPKPPSSMSSRVDRELETIVLKALEKDRSHRYQSAADLGADIKRYLAGEPVCARRSSVWYVLRKKVAKHRLWVVLGAAAVALGLIGTGGGIWWSRHTQEGQRTRDLAAERTRQETDGQNAALAAQRCLEAGDIDRAFTEATTLSQMFPELPQGRLIAAHAYFQRYRDRGNLDDSAEACNHLQEDPNHPSTHWADCALLAEMRLALGAEGEAKQLRDKADREMPDTPQAQYLQSFATLQLGQARQCAEQAVKSTTDARLAALAWRRLTFLRLQMQDYDGAVEGARRLAVYGWSGFDLVMFEGEVRTKQGDYRAAIECYSQATKLHPDDFDPYRRRAIAHLCLKEYDDALNDWSQAVTIAGDTALWLSYHRVTLRWIKGQTDIAAQELHRFCQSLQSPSYGPARLFLILDERARRAAREGRSVEAARDQDTAEKVLAEGQRMTEPGHWLWRIYECLRQSDPNGLESAAKTPREQCEACYYAGEVCLRRGQIEDARAWFTAAEQTKLRLDPQSITGDPLNEYHLAVWRLDQLKAQDSAATQP